MVRHHCGSWHHCQAPFGNGAVTRRHHPVKVQPVWHYPQALMVRPDSPAKSNGASAEFFTSAACWCRCAKRVEMVVCKDGHGKVRAIQANRRHSTGNGLIDPLAGQPEKNVKLWSYTYISKPYTRDCGRLCSGCGRGADAVASANLFK
jgi:hypothetical protein